MMRSFDDTQLFPLSSWETQIRGFKVYNNKTRALRVEKYHLFIHRKIISYINTLLSETLLYTLKIEMHVEIVKC